MRQSLNIGDVVRLVDNEQRHRAEGEPGRSTEPAVRKHLQVIVEVIQERAYVAPILTNRTVAPKACPLNPGDMPPGILDRPSYLDYLLISTRSLGELQRDVDRGKIPKVTTCPRATLLRITAALRAPGTDLNDRIRRELMPVAPPVAPVGRVLRSTQPQPAIPLPAVLPSVGPRPSRRSRAHP